MLRRTAAGLAVTAAVLMSAAAPTALGDSDVQLVTAKVFSPAGETTDVGYLSALKGDPSGCPDYVGGAYTMNESNGGQEDSLFNKNDDPQTGTWPISSVLECLQTPIVPTEQMTVYVLQGGAVENSSDSGYSALSYDDLTGADLPPGEPAFLTVGGLIGYDRPPHDSQDDDAIDQVLDSSPLAIEVFEGTRTIRVPLTQTPTTVAPGGTVTFTSGVNDGSGYGPLTYDWNNDGLTVVGSSSQYQETLRVPNGAGAYAVSLEVHDNVGDTGLSPPLRFSVQSSTPTSTATTPSSTATTTTPIGGNGSGSSGPSQGSGGSSSSAATGTTANPVGTSPTSTSTAPEATSTTHHAGTTSQATATHTTTAATTTHTTAVATGSGSSGRSGGGSGPGPSSTSSAHSGTSHTASTPGHTATPPQPLTSRTSSRSVITGLLISDLAPVPAGASPLTQPTAQPGAGRAAGLAPKGHHSLLLPLSVSAAVLLLLGLGSGQELRSRRFRVA